MDHPSCSKQHAVLQYRLVSYEKEDGTNGKKVKCVLLELPSDHTCTCITVGVKKSVSARVGTVVATMYCTYGLCGFYINCFYWGEPEQAPHN